MGKKIDKLIAFGGSVAAAVNIVDRITSWWDARGEAKAEAKRIAAWKKAAKLEHEFQRKADLAAIALGRPMCTVTGCKRSLNHPGPCGPLLKPWKDIGP